MELYEFHGRTMFDDHTTSTARSASLESLGGCSPVPIATSKHCNTLYAYIHYMYMRILCVYIYVYLGI